MAPTTMVTAAQELGWLTVLLTIDEALAREPGDVLSLLDGLIVPDWGSRRDRFADFSRKLGEQAEARGLPVVRVRESLLGPDASLADYRRALVDLFGAGAREAMRRERLA
jgi:hypothetical protein